MKTLLSRWLPLLACMTLIFAVSMDRNPYRDLPSGFSQPVQTAANSIAKAIVGHPVNEQELLGQPGHVIEYALLALAAANALIWMHKPTAGALMLTFIACVLYALSDEIHQIFVPGRAFETADLVLDAAGIFTGLLLYWGIRSRLERRKNNASKNSGQ